MDLQAVSVMGKCTVPLQPFLQFECICELSEGVAFFFDLGVWKTFTLVYYCMTLRLQLVLFLHAVVAIKSYQIFDLGCLL